MSFCDKKCSIQLDKLKLEKKELELLFADYQNAWECCEKGGNFTNQGYCSYEWQDKVKLLENRFLRHLWLFIQQLQAWRNHSTMMQTGMLILAGFNAVLVLVGLVWVICKIFEKCASRNGNGHQEKPLLQRTSQFSNPKIEPVSILKGGNNLTKQNTGWGSNTSGSSNRKTAFKESSSIPNKSRNAHFEDILIP